MPEKWVEKDGIIRLSQPLVSDGTTGEAWIRRSYDKGTHVNALAKSFLRSADFVPTCGVEYKVAVLKGSSFADNARLITAYICAEADRRVLVKAHAELACLIRELVTDDDLRAMGLWRIVVMHDSINDSVGLPLLLGADRDPGGPWLCAYHDLLNHRWNWVNGFAFQEAPST